MTATSDEYSNVYEWLDAARSEAKLKGGQRRYDLLDYLVREELEGRGENVKAYAIALDVLGRGEDFDPATDSIVRVEVARLRDALELHYARSSEPNEPRITIPKGSYRPRIEFPARVSPKPARDVRRDPRRISNNVAWLVIAACISFAVYFVFFDRRADPVPANRPVLEVAKIAAVQSSERFSFALGFRQQLISDLAHLPTVIVRDGPISADDVRSQAAPPADYRVSITPVIEGSSGIIGLQLASLKEAAIVWSRTIPISDGTSDFYTELTEAVRGIGQEVAGPSGAITIEQATLALRTIADGNSLVGDYQCLIVSLTFDATKDAALGHLSRECLHNAVAQNTQNTTLLASYALNQFFESSGIPGAEGQLRMEEARAHAIRAVQINPSDAFAQEVLGNILSALGDRSGAIERYHRAVELAPSRPAPHFLLGWQMALQGDWDAGVATMQEGIDMQPNIPGYMIIPLALNAFRRSDYSQSLSYAQAVIDRGDPRGYSLAFAASLALDDVRAAEGYFYDPQARTSSDPLDPMREVRVTFSNPDVMPRYQEVVDPFLSRLESR